MIPNRELPQWSRRKFMKAAFGGSAMVMLGQFGLFRLAQAKAGENSLTMIVVNYAKCTGCRTCETVCSAYNHQQTVNGETLNGLGNPDLANIRVYGYNLEKHFNYRAGFTRADDVVPDRFFEDPLTVGEKKGSILTREQFKTMMDEFYTQRGWDLDTSAPTPEKLKILGLAA